MAALAMVPLESHASIYQGISNISLVLGIEATRTLEEETFNGVRLVVLHSCAILQTEQQIGNACRSIYGDSHQAKDRLDAYSARWTWDGGGTGMWAPAR